MRFAVAGTNLKYIDRITFLQNSAWPYNSESLVWHKGDIRKFTITGDAVKPLNDRDIELAFVLVREGKNGQKPMWVALTKDKYVTYTSVIRKLFKSSYCPTVGKAKEIANIIGSEWDFFKSKFDEARLLGGGELRVDGSYLYDSYYFQYLDFWYEMIWLSNGWIHSDLAHEACEQILLKIDWINDGDIPLRATDGTDVTSAFEDSRGSYHNLFDGMSDTRWCTNHQTWASQSNPLYWVEFESDSPIKPTGYVFTTSDTDRWPQTSWDSKPHNWKLYGKLKLRNEWTLLDQRSGENLPSESYKEKKYNLSNANGEYQFFRLEITDNQPWLCIADFKFNL